LFIFEKAQKIYNIGNIAIGGQPGELATVLAGTIFYKGQKIIKDPKKGVFDKSKAKLLIERQDYYSALTGNPCIVHIYGETPPAIQKYIAFTVETTDTPIIIDSNDLDTRLEALRFSNEIGIKDKVIYNSLNVSVQEKEIAVLSDLSPESAIILCFNPKDNSLKGRLEIFETGATLLPTGLHNIAQKINIKKILIDPAITPIGQGSGIAIRSGLAFKSKYGYPVGAGVHNVPASWLWLNKLKKNKKLGKEIFRICDVSSNLIQQALGGNFLLYGPIRNAPFIFPSVAMCDCMISDAVKEFHIVQKGKHPSSILV
jgi:tetrahydromethanopterin S-methyltransferase subunit H